MEINKEECLNDNSPELMECNEMSNEMDEINTTSDESDASTDELSNHDNIKQLNQLRQKLKDNLYDYAAHVELIKLLRLEGELEELRNAREVMCKIFPLTEGLWLEWIKDEIGLTSMSKQEIMNLFEKALNDYLSIEIWIEYLQFCLGDMTNEEVINNMRNLFERSLSLAGYHVAKGSLLWDFYREFEHGILRSIQNVSKNSDVDNHQILENQYKKLLLIFKRQLSIPLLDMSNTYRELQDWINDEIPSDINEIYQKTIGILQSLIPFEEKLIETESDNLESYLSYLEYEKKQENQFQTRCLFERALAENCLQSDLWLNYINFLKENGLPLKVQILVIERAIRNCPWCALLYDLYMKALEKDGAKIDLIRNIVEQAFTVGFPNAEDYRNLWLAYIDFLRRNIPLKDASDYHLRIEELRSIFNKACEHLAQNFGLGGDPLCLLLRYWAYFESAVCNDMEQARQLWNDILSQANDSLAHMWLEYFYLERNYGDKKHCRRLLQRALSAVQDYPELIIQTWLSFERIEGSLDSFEICETKVHSRMLEIEQSKYFSKTKREDLDKHKKSVKRKSSPAPLETKNIKKPYISKENETNNNALEMKSVAHVQAVAHDSLKDCRTVFLSNLPYDTDADSIKEIFQNCGKITDLRLVHDYRGRFKGFCYLEFESELEQLEALKKDRTLLKGRPVFVSKCESKSTHNRVFKFATSLEKNKLFVKGLSKKTTQDDLNKLFSCYGPIKDIRLVTLRSGQSKGLAYIEFINESNAGQALLKTDGMEIDGKIISVAISNPPDRKNISNSSDPLTLSLGKKGFSYGKRGKGRTQLSLLPRTITNKQLTREDHEVNDQQSKQLNNSEFRKMFLKEN